MATRRELLTQRQAALILQDPTRPGLTRRLAHQVLAAGFAGEPVATGSTLLYDADEVRRLADLPDAARMPLPDECGSALLVVRTSAQPGAALRPEELRLTPPPGPLRFSIWADLELRVVIEAQGFVPTVVTSASYVLATANLTELRGGDRTPRGWTAELALDSPGDWAQAFADRRLVTPRGNPWLLWTPRLQPFALAGGQRFGS